MNSSLEKFLSYVLGGVTGFAGGLIVVSFHMEIFETNGLSSIVLLVFSLVGVLIAMLLTEYRLAKFLKKNGAIRDETVALITHEMRTALTSSGWAIDLILNKYKTVIVPEDILLLKDAVGSIHSTVMHSVNLLDVSLLDINKLSISLEWIKLEKIENMFKEILEKYKIGANKESITLTGGISLSHDRMAEVDMLRLRIVLENLIENSIQYIGTGTKSIDVKISNDEKNMIIVVKDSGIGIPESEREKISSEFFRASNARKALGSGSGIGLYICYRYVRAHRGAIRFESAEGKGTTFFITIPLNTVADVEGFLKKI